MKQIQEFLSENKTTERARFSFPVPETIEADLTQCYQRVVEDFGSKFVPTKDTQIVINATARWFQYGKIGLILSGVCGTGKSKLLSAISLLIKFYTNNYQKLGIFTAPDICEISRAKDEDSALEMGRIKRRDYLGIDDLGTEALTVKSWGTNISPVIDTLYARYDNQKVTIITTNDSLDVIKTKYGERIYDRLCEQYDRVIFNFKSFRQ